MHKAAFVDFVTINHSALQRSVWATHDQHHKVEHSTPNNPNLNHNGQM